MTIKKSIRTRNRYILFDYISELPKQADELQEELNQLMQQMYGVLGAPQLKLLSFSNNRGILKCSLEHFVAVRQALALLTFPLYRIRQVRSSGTIKGLVNK